MSVCETDLIILFFQISTFYLSFQESDLSIHVNGMWMKFQTIFHYTSAFFYHQLKFHFWRIKKRSKWNWKQWVWKKNFSCLYLFCNYTVSNYESINKSMKPKWRQSKRKCEARPWIISYSEKFVTKSEKDFFSSIWRF